MINQKQQEQVFNSGILIILIAAIIILTIIIGLLLKILLPKANINLSNWVVFLSAFVISALATVIIL